MDFGFTKGVQDETPIIFAVVVYFRVAREEMKRNAVILFREDDYKEINSSNFKRVSGDMIY